MNTDTHAVLGRSADGFEILASGLEWREAQELWQQLDAKRLSNPWHRFELAGYRYFEVRSTDDPKVKAARKARVHRLSAYHDERTLSDALVKAAKDAAKTRGYSGRVGGWIYNRCGQPVCQGWAVFASRARRAAMVEYLPGLGWKAV